jgi:AbrB family looped-hinge helix DNA binding protein
MTSPQLRLGLLLDCHLQMVMVLVDGMKDVFVPIDKAGRVVLPKDVRDELAIHPGDLLKISIHGNEVTLRPNKETGGFIKRGKALVFSSEGADLLDNEMVENVRNAARGALLNNFSKGLPLQKRK